MIFLKGFFINIIEAFIFYAYSNGMEEKKSIREKGLHKYAFLLVSACIASLPFMTALPYPATLTVRILFYCIYVYLFFSPLRIRKAVWAAAFFISMLAAYFITSAMPGGILSADISPIPASNPSPIPASLVYITVLTVITVTILCFTSDTFKLSLFEKSGFLFLLVLCVVIENLIIFGREEIYSYEPQLYSYLLYAIFFLVIILFLTLTLYIYNLGKAKEKNIRLSELQTVAEMEKSQYSQVISSISELRYMKHDIANHMETLSSLIANERYAEASDYISGLTESLENNHYLLASGNVPVDSIVTNKLIQCRSLNISVNYSVHLVNNIPLSDIEICSVLGNLFDNAIRASEKVTDAGRRNIDFHIRPYREMLSVTMSNHVGEKLLLSDDGTILSSVRNAPGHEHGLGLARIRSIVEKYGGIMNIEHDGDTFSVSLLIPCNSEVTVE